MRCYSYIFLLLLFIHFFVSCGSDNNEKVNLDLSEMINYSDVKYEYMLNNKGGKLIFLFDGDCGYCFNKLLIADSIFNANRHRYGDINSLAILTSDFYQLLEYRLESISISIPIFIDTLDSFNCLNQTNNNTTLLINSSNKIMYKGDYLSKEKRFFQKMGKCKH